MYIEIKVKWSKRLQENQEQITATVKLQKQEALQKPAQETHTLQRPRQTISKQIQVG